MVVIMQFKYEQIHSNYVSPLGPSFPPLSINGDLSRRQIPERDVAFQLTRVAMPRQHQEQAQEKFAVMFPEHLFM